jgi:dTDP-4-dehydrorhamnose 3,5-epimerase
VDHGRRWRRLNRRDAAPEAVTMDVQTTPLLGLLLLTPRVFRDHRGYFLETWSQERYRQAGVPAGFVQDNLSWSSRDVLRGLHYQHPRAQGKLLSVLAGEVFDVAVDIRVGSPTFGQWWGVTLSAENARQLYVPPGLAHGFVVTSDSALVSYKCTALYHPEDEGSVLWNDPELAIGWPVESPRLSAKDAAAPRLAAIDPSRLPRFEEALLAE